MTVSTYNMADLFRLVDVSTPVNTHFMDTYFKQEVRFYTPEFSLDTIDKKKRLAPFCSPLAQGVPMKKEGYSTRSLKPAYIKPMQQIDPHTVFTRKAGEQFGPIIVSPAAREQALIAETFLDLRQQVDLRFEWMCREAIVFGKIIVDGDHYPNGAVEIDFGRNASLTSVTGYQWSDQTNANPMKDLQAQMLKSQKLSASSTTRIYFGTEAWDAFTSHPEVLKAIKVLDRGTTASFDPTSGTQDGEGGFQFQGTLFGGKVELWTCFDFYMDNTGAEVQALDPKKVVGVGNISGVQAYGPIINANAKYEPIPVFPSQWIPNSPAITHCQVESAPLMVPANPNASWVLTVLS